MTFTQPASVTCLPISLLQSELQLLVRYMGRPRVPRHSGRSEQSRKRLHCAVLSAVRICQLFWVSAEDSGHYSKRQRSSATRFSNPSDDTSSCCAVAIFFTFT